MSRADDPADVDVEVDRVRCTVIWSAPPEAAHVGGGPDREAHR